MGRPIEIIDPEGERRNSRRRRLFTMVVFLSLLLFGYPEVKEYYFKWRTLLASRKLATYLSNLKTRAILEKTPFEARFRLPDQIDIYKATSCGPFAERLSVGGTRVSDFGPDIEFAPEPWVRENMGTREPYLPRFCYDPVYGSSITSDGLVHGGIFLAHHADLGSKRGEHAVVILIEGAAGEMSLE